MDNLNFKVAIPSNNGKRVSGHFGPTKTYAVITVEEGNAVSSEMREKFSHHKGSHSDEEMDARHRNKHGNDETENTDRDKEMKEHSHEHDHDHKHHHRNHNKMLENILDCDYMVVGGMGSPVYKACEKEGIKPVLTDLKTVDEVVEAIKNGTLKDRKENLH